MKSNSLFMDRPLTGLPPARFPLPRRAWGLIAFVVLTTLAPAAVTPLPDDPACTAEDRKFMARAIELAAAATAHATATAPTAH
jgi:hypothetical protein